MPCGSHFSLRTLHGIRGAGVQLGPDNLGMDIMRGTIAIIVIAALGYFGYELDQGRAINAGIAPRNNGGKISIGRTRTGE